MATVPINTDIYQFGQWAQPNTRNIGDSLLDLYRMKREIEKDKMDREEARMNMDLQKLSMQQTLENAKKEREGQKAFAELMKGQTVEKPVITPGSVISGLTRGAGALGSMFENVTRGSFPQTPPQMPSLSTTQRTLKPVDFKDPVIQAKLVQILASMPSKAGVLDDALRAAMAPESRTLTPEQRMEELKFKAETKKALETRQAQLLQQLTTQKLDARAKESLLHDLRAFTSASALLDQGADRKTALEWLHATLNAPIKEGLMNGQAIVGTVTINPTTMQPVINPIKLGGGLPANSVVEPAGGTPFTPVTDFGATGPGMQIPEDVLAQRDAARAAANDSQALYQETPGEGAPASGSVQTPPATGTEVPKAGVLQPMPKAAKGALTEKDLQNIRMYWDRDTGKAMQTALRDYRRVEETIKTIEYKASRGEPVALDQMAAFWDAIRAIDNSVVRPGELQLFYQAQSIYDTFKNRLSRIENDPAQVRLLTMQMSRDLAAMGRRAYRATYDAYEARKEGFVRQFAPPYVQSGLIDSENDFLAALNEAYKPEGVPMFEQGGKAAPGNPPAVEAGMSTPKWTKLSNGSWAWVSRDANGKPYMMGGK